MKNQRALRLRHAGKHHWTRARLESERPWAREVHNNLARAFEMNAAPKHSDEEPEPPYVTMDYVTGVYTWHGRVTFWPGPQTFNVQDFGSETS